MKRTFSLFAFMLMLFSASAQDVYWVFLTDKAGATFDPYAYFDAKAIERYRQCGADLYDQTNYPLSSAYVDGVDAIATEEVGQSRWMNAIGVTATPDQIVRIEALPYVSRVQMIGGNMQLARVVKTMDEPTEPADIDSTLSDQLLRMQGQLFRKAGIDGKGIRIAVLDNGFTRVHTHDAFKHVRDDGRILKTWNFPLRREDVYGWGTHGTMTFSNIAGRQNGKDLGLATGAEFLLARTEVASEPFKEEIWWMQGMEWADRNGANIISSSLGYGKDRYYTKDMDGTAYVAKAANLAARKGMLVVNSAGNEGDDSKWRYIITPSDADSVLCVGGITNSLTEYEHISFASYGPTADGRQKPNVCAFAHTWAASPRNDHAYEMVYGTSFSCPLVAGFAACAWQASKGKTAMQMLDALQRSADLYPYCDYAFGYGVPQASYFLNGGNEGQDKAPTFRFEQLSPTSVSVIPIATATNVNIFYKDIDAEGRIIAYGKRSVDLFDTAMSLDFNGGHHLVVHINGYTADYRFENPTVYSDYNKWVNFRRTDSKLQYNVTDAMDHDLRNEKADETHLDRDFYFQLGLPVSFMHEGGEITSCIWSPAKRIGLRYQYKFSKAYGIGFGIEYGHVAYRYNGRRINDLERFGLGMLGIINSADRITSRKLNIGEWSAELFQRVRFVPGGMIGHKGLHWDLGVFVGYMFNDYRIAYSYNNDGIANSHDLKLKGLDALEDQRFQWGVVTRIAYDNIGVYARGTISRLTDVQYMLPFVEVGIQLMY